MSIRGPFPTSRSGSRAGPARVTAGSPTKSYDPTAWAEKKRLAIARAEKLKVERRKAKEAAASREKVVGEEEETLLEVHDNVNYNPLSYVDNGNARKEEDAGGTLRGESEFLRTKAVEEYLKQGEGKEEVPEEGEKTGPMQWEWIGPPQTETRPAEGGENGGVGEEGKSTATPAELRDSDAVGGGVPDVSAAEQQQPADALPTSLAEKLSRRREPPTARQPKSGSVRPRLLEGRGPPEGHPLQTRSKPRLLNSSSGRVRGAAAAEAKRSGKSSEVKAAERRVGGKAAPPTRRPPPPPKARDGINSASTQATTASGDARVSRKGSSCSVEGSRRKRTAAAAKAVREEDPSTRQMYDKNTLRIIGRDSFIKAIRLWRKDNMEGGSGPDAGGGTEANQGGGGGVHVCVRKRPLFEKEESVKLEYDVVSCIDEHTVTLHNCLYQADLKRPLISHLSCKFARIFDEGADNEFVYKNSGSQQMVLNACRGGLSTMFMFGQTGSGKTHTMTSIESRAAKDIFQNIPEGSSVTVSFIEICGKHVFDLVPPRRTEIRLRDAGKNTVILEGAESVAVDDADRLIEIARQSHTRRKTETTGANDVSSRSHAVCRITITKPGDSGTGSLVLVDCAGTERRKDSFYHDKIRQQEGAEINASLHALKECIRYRMLRQNNTGVTVEKEGSTFVPFRASALTRVLAEGFVRPDALLHVMATISPCATDIEHSISTLKAVSMLSGKEDALTEVRQTELFPIVKKELPKHPKHWDEEKLRRWIGTVSNGAFKAVQLASGTTGAMAVRWPAKRFVQLCGGDEARGHRLYNSLHSIMDEVTKVKENQRKETRCFHSNQQANRERLLKDHGRTGIVGGRRDHIQS